MERLGGLLGRLGAFLGVLGRSFVSSMAFCTVLGMSLGALGLSWGFFAFRDSPGEFRIWPPPPGPPPPQGKGREGASLRRIHDIVRSPLQRPRPRRPRPRSPLDDGDGDGDHDDHDHDHDDDNERKSVSHTPTGSADFHKADVGSHKLWVASCLRQLPSPSPSRAPVAGGEGRRPAAIDRVWPHGSWLQHTECSACARPDVVVERRPEVSAGMTRRRRR